MSVILLQNHRDVLIVEETNFPIVCLSIYTDDERVTQIKLDLNNLDDHEVECLTEKFSSQNHEWAIEPAVHYCFGIQN
ncbi:hypothetical protein [Bacillus suaedaesalsae]|uniref:DUF3906 family protein n=1 Tax=Bacillus suaedaesalsae TaxID=2810349 RepID=A0ABS2DJH8_9BACI|nr:hypothetical protein [Bacillus suaedaesalsae]MBM6618649.1 hypothetical protein [Bacillus suaedaesalsae]